MARMTGPGGLLPEQIWDGDPIPDRYLFPGRPSGSAMPLVWAHAEFLKLLADRANGRPAEVLDAVATRWNGRAPRAATWHWRPETPFTELPAGRGLSIEAAAPFRASIAIDGQAAEVHEAEEIGFGMYGVALSAERLASVTHLSFDLGGDATVEGARQEVTIIP
jgi:glucoamylase